MDREGQRAEQDEAAVETEDRQVRDREPPQEAITGSGAHGRTGRHPVIDDRVDQNQR